MNLKPDHILIAAPGLEAGSDYAESVIGTRPVPGGSHPGQGTRNALLGLEADVYIEVIAPDPGQSPDLPIPAFLSSLEAPVLAWWCARCEDLPRLKGRLRDAGIGTGPVDPWTRRLQDGSSLRWHLLMPGDNEFGATLPFFIHWDDMDRHPSRHLPVVGRLESLVVRHPAPGDIQSLFRAPVAVEAAATGGIEVRLATAQGTVDLRTPATHLPAFGAIAGY